MSTQRRLIGSILKLLALVVPMSVASAAPIAEQDGAILYQKYCAQCHDSGAPRIPARASLQLLSREQIMRALESGSMRIQGAERTGPERVALAAFLSSGSASAESAKSDLRKASCKFSRPEPVLTDTQWNGWGRSPINDRFASAHDSGLTPATVRKLHLRWAFGFPDANEATVQPTVIGRYVFVGSSSGRLYALDLKEGCIYWTFNATQAIRSAVSVGRMASGELAAFFTDRGANVYSVNAQTGALRWKQSLRRGETGGGSTGSPKLYAGRLYVPLTSGSPGEGVASLSIECCTAHGRIVAMDAQSGKVLWDVSTLREEPHMTQRNSAGTQLSGPSGVSV